MLYILVNVDETIVFVAATLSKIFRNDLMNECNFYVEENFASVYLRKVAAFTLITVDKMSKFECHNAAHKSWFELAEYKRTCFKPFAKALLLILTVFDKYFSEANKARNRKNCIKREQYSIPRPLDWLCDGNRIDL